ncbi:MAG: putative Ig domain-containing protein, partial [Bacteroidales bacterium]|nr:putative Ig domain-containing protein [Bacteroidales bacterium]
MKQYYPNSTEMKTKDIVTTQLSSEENKSTMQHNTYREASGPRQSSVLSLRKLAAAILLFVATAMPSMLTAQTNPDTALCQGQTLNLTARLVAGQLGTSPYTYAWTATPNASGYTPGLPATTTTTGSTDTYNTIVISPAPKSGETYTDYTYTCTITDAHSCQKVVSVKVRVYPTPTISVDPSAPTVCRNNNSVTLTASGANAYAWSPATYLSSASVANPTATPTGTITYTVTGTDTYNYTNNSSQSRTKTCSNTGSVTVTVIDTIVPVISSDDDICISSSEANNVLTLTQTATAAGYTYEWSVGTGGTILSGQGTNVITAKWTSHGDKTVTVTMTKDGCTSRKSKTIHVRPKPAASIAELGSPVCPSAGSVSLTGTVTTTTTANYTYHWGGALTVTSTNPATNNLTSNTASMTIPTTPCNKAYKVGLDVTDHYGCKVICDSVTVTVQDNAGPTITGTLPTINHTSCGTKPDAYANVTALIGALQGTGKGITDNCTSTANLTLEYSDGAVSGSCNKTFTRTYTVKDACGNGSTITQTINLNIDDDISITGGTNSKTVECASAIVLPHTITPSVMPTVTDACGTTLSYKTGAGQPAVGGTYTDCEGTKTYTYTYEDCAGHTATWTYTYTIDRTTPPAEVGGPVATSSTVACLTATGTAPSLPEMKDVCGTTLSPSAPVKDTVWEAGKTGCKGVVRWNYTYTDCSGLSTVWTYTYNINDNVAPTIGTVAVPDAVASSNCKYAIPNLQSATLAVSSDNCNTVSWVSQSPAAGTLYTQTDVAQNITVTVKVQDACGNQQTKDVTVVIPANTFTVNTIDSTYICGGGNALRSRTLTTTPTNNNGDVTWSWAPTTGIAYPSTSTSQNPTVQPSTTTRYVVTATDANGCIAKDSVKITVSPAIVPNISINPNPICEGESVTISSTPSGGSGTYTTYAWTTTAGTSTIVNAAAASTSATPTSTGTVTYKVVVTDDQGCNNTASQSVTVNPKPTLTINSFINPLVQCNGGTASLPVGGAAGSAAAAALPLSFSSDGTNWSEGFNVTPKPYTFNLEAGDYTLYLRNGYGCIDTKPVHITEPPAVTIVSKAKTQPTCNGYDNGQMVITVTGGTPASTTVAPYYSTVTLNGNAPTSSSKDGDNYIFTFSGLSASNSHTLYIKDKNNCELTIDTIKLGEPTAVTVAAITPSATTVCLGSDVTLGTTGATGGTPNSPVAYTYQWTCATSGNGIPGSATSTSVTAHPTSANTFTYTITATDKNTCTGTASTTVVVYDTASLAVTNNDQTKCLGTAIDNIVITYEHASLAITSGTLPAGLSMTNNTSPDTISGTPTTANDYSFTITASNTAGCKTKNQVIHITVNDTVKLTPLAAQSEEICLGTAITKVPIHYEHGTLSVTPALPAGLVLTDHGAGLDTIKGTPTYAQAATTYTITAHNANC